MSEEEAQEVVEIVKTLGIAPRRGTLRNEPTKALPILGQHLVYRVHERRQPERA